MSQPAAVKERRPVFTYFVRPSGKKDEVRAGTAFIREDGRIDIELNIIPLDGHLRIPNERAQ